VDEAEDIITLIDEEGQPHRFILDQIVEVDEKEYALLLPADPEEVEDDEEGEPMLVLRIVDSEDPEGQPELVMIEDEEEFQRVIQYLVESGDEVEEGTEGFPVKQAE
jgi:putative Holliday junction resolvase